MARRFLLTLLYLGESNLRVITKVNYENRYTNPLFFDNIKDAIIYQYMPIESFKREQHPFREPKPPLRVIDGGNHPVLTGERQNQSLLKAELLKLEKRAQQIQDEVFKREHSHAIMNKYTTNNLLALLILLNAW